MGDNDMEQNKTKHEEAIWTIPRCRNCGSERVVRNALACWNPAYGLWETETVLTGDKCLVCDGVTELDWYRSTETCRARVRELNDRLRVQGAGNGSVMVTIGVQEQGAEFLIQAIQAVRAFSAFSEENDPWNEHDFGAVEVEDSKVFFKIDYYDPTLSRGSENPGNEQCTHRVLTIMLASEY